MPFGARQDNARVSSRVSSRGVCRSLHRTDQPHTHLQRSTLPRQSPTTAHQRAQPRSKGGVEALDVGGVEHTGTEEQRLGCLLASLDNTVHHTDDTPLLVLLDDLSQTQIRRAKESVVPCARYLRTQRKAR